MSEPNAQIPDDVYREIAESISSDTSPVGIDAKKTHVMIIHQLDRIEARLRRIEEALEGKEE